jgi:CRISPR-associated protein (TIGR02584 family)
MKMKNILIAVSGMTPQIITETLYVLAVERKIVIDSIFVITTEKGSRFIDDQIQKKAMIFNLYNTYKLATEILPSVKKIILKDDAEIPLEDVRTPGENLQAARQIINFIRRQTSDPHTALHCSIAGGRKTMSAYLALAMNLFGRKQDHLSHVLVSPAKVEDNKEFFFPEPGDAANRIELTDIPYIHLRTGLSKYFGNMENIEFEDLLRLTNSEIEDWQKEIKAQLNVDQHILFVQWGNHHYEVPISPKNFTIYSYLFKEKTPQILTDNQHFREFFKRHYDSERKPKLDHTAIQQSISELNKDYLEPKLPPFLLPFLKVTADATSRFNQYLIQLPFESRQLIR